MNIFEKIARRITRLSWNKTVHHIMLEAEKRRIINSHQLHEILGAWNNECFPERGHASFLKAVEHRVQRTGGTYPLKIDDGAELVVVKQYDSAGDEISISNILPPSTTSR